MRFPRRLTVPFLVAVVAFSPSRFLAVSLSAQAPVRVMTYNIRYGTAQDGEHVWPNRREHLMTVIRDHAPHILGVQEALHFQVNELRAALPGHAAVGVGRDDGIDKGEYAAILVDTARFEVISSGTTWFSDTPTVPGSTSWGNSIPRITTWALLRDRATHDRAWVYNLHLDHQSQPSREKSVEFLLAEHRRRSDSQRARDANAAEYGGAESEPGLVIMGDFNSGEDNPALHAALANGLRSALRVIHPEAPFPGTYTGFEAAPVEATGVIDHILVDHRWKVLSAGIDSRKFGLTWPSDHFPVWTTIERREP